MSDHAVSEQGHWMNLEIKLQDITSQQTVMLLLTTTTTESWVSGILNHTKFMNLHYSTSSWDMWMVQRLAN